jgi:hypothetical protein
VQTSQRDVFANRVVENSEDVRLGEYKEEDNKEGDLMWATSHQCLLRKQRIFRGCALISETRCIVNM